MSVYEVLDDWAAKLDAAGVAVLLDSRGQYSAPAGYVLIVPNGRLTPGTARAYGRPGRGPWLMAGTLYAVVDGPWGTAQGRAIDVLLDAAAGVLGEYLDAVDFPGVLELAAVGISQPAAALTYSQVPVSIGA